jgi:hypothetical protein
MVYQFGIPSLPSVSSEYRYLLKEYLCCTSIEALIQIKLFWIALDACMLLHQSNSAAVQNDLL